MADGIRRGLRKILHRYFTFREIRDARLAICQQCALARHLPVVGVQCTVCHCMMEAKTWLADVSCADVTNQRWPVAPRDMSIPPEEYEI